MPGAPLKAPLRFRVQGFTVYYGFRVQSLGFCKGIYKGAMKLRVYGYKIQGFRLRVEGFKG